MSGGAMSRRKGAAFEREVVALAREAGFAGAKRTAPMQSAGYADTFADVSGVGRLAIECKRRRVGALRECVAHVTGPERPGYVNVGVARDDGGEPLAVLRLSDLLKLERDALAVAARPAGTEAAVVMTPSRDWECKCGAFQLGSDCPEWRAWDGGIHSAERCPEQARVESTSEADITGAG